MILRWKLPREALSAVEILEAILECPYRDSSQRLVDLVFADLRYTYHLLANEPKKLELAQVVMQERPHFQIESLRRERRALQRILKEGVAAGEFQIDNIAHTTTALHAATLKYRYAQLFTNQTLDELERELAHVLTLVLRGLKARLPPMPVILSPCRPAPRVSAKSLTQIGAHSHPNPKKISICVTDFRQSSIL